MKPNNKIMIYGLMMVTVILIGSAIGIVLVNEKTIYDKNLGDIQPDTNNTLGFNVTYGIYMPWNLGHTIFTISDNGSIIIENHYFSWDDESYENLTYEYKQLSITQIYDFKKLVDQIDIFSFNNSYINYNTTSTVTDQPSSTLTFIK